jgi:hypothetical protein
MTAPLIVASQFVATPPISIWFLKQAFGRRDGASHPTDEDVFPEIGCRAYCVIRIIPTSSAPLSGADWVHEIKHDAYRLIGPPRLRASAADMRNGNDYCEIVTHAAGVFVACG